MRLYTYEEALYVGIAFKTIEIDDNSGYITLPNATESFKFSDEVAINGNVTYVVSKDEYGYDTVVTKTIPLAEGNNTVYVIETISGEVTNVYKITIRRKPIYTVSFTASDGQKISPQYVEEDFCATQPKVNLLLGYTLAFDYDFSKPITENTRVSVTVQPSPEMENYYFTSTATTCDVTGLKNENVSEIIIPDCVTSVSALGDDKNLTVTDIVIGKNLINIDATAFAICVNRKNIIVSAESFCVLHAPCKHNYTR